ncbi:uncharacterized protein LOC117898390 [Drosophila subobscura]|uniref:uncharacterized protein LOC117898390 n=1 Tax=Drosophila subobscura TaxID=7241 RepID=UPI00155B0101|nr:uncharacterized protein LOC117898390 [Drosophila subobscura]
MMEETRVVVLLGNTKPGLPAIEPSGDTFTGTPPGRGPPPQVDAFENGGQVSILDEKTLRLVYCQNASKPHLLMAQSCHFDVLTDKENENELPAVLQAMFVDRRDGFIMHLKVERECHLMFLLDALVIQLKAKLQRGSLRLVGGTVRFRKLLEDDRGGEGGNTLETHFAFNNVHGLMTWLLNQYRMRADLSTGPGHEALEVEYFVSHLEQDLKFNVRLYVLLVAMEELSVSSLCGLRCYFSDDWLTSALVATELTSFIQEAADEPRSKPLYMLVLFHVLATGHQVDAKNVQLLSLAHLISRRQHSQHQDQMSSTSSSLSQPSQSEMCQQALNDGFKLVHDSLLQYVRQTEQMKRCRQVFDEHLAEYEELLLQIANTELRHMLQASQSSLLQLTSLLEKRS